MKLKKCAVCGSTKNLHHHHFIPLSLGGKDEDENILTLCVEHHNFIHKLEGNLDHKKLIKFARAKKKENNEFLGGWIPFGHKAIETGEVRLMRSGVKTKIKKIDYDVGSKDYKILKFIIAQRLKYKPISYKKLQIIMLHKFNKVLDYAQIYRITKRESQKEHWNYLRS